MCTTSRSPCSYGFDLPVGATVAVFLVLAAVDNLLTASVSLVAKSALAWQILGGSPAG